MKTQTLDILDYKDNEVYSNLRKIIILEKGKQHISNSKLALISGVGRPTISNFLNGKLGYMSFHNIIKILSSLSKTDVVIRLVEGSLVIQMNDETYILYVL